MCEAPRSISSEDDTAPAFSIGADKDIASPMLQNDLPMPTSIKPR